MDTPRLPESLRARMAQKAAQTPMENVREFVDAFLDDALDLDEVETGLRVVAATTTRGLERWSQGLETVLADPPRDGTLARMLERNGNWVPDDPTSDDAAVSFLRGVADTLRRVIDDAAGR